MPKAKKTTRVLMDLEECSCTGRHLDKFVQPATLAILAKEPLHGYALVEQLKAMPMFEGQAPDSTGVYRLLNTMEERGLVASQWDTSGGGPAKKLYVVTDGGRDCLARWLTTLDEYHDRLGQMVKALRATARGRRPSKGCQRRK